MKKIEDIEKEYDSFPLQSDFVTNLEEYQCFLQVGIDDLKEADSAYRKELRDNHIWQAEAKVRNALFFLFQLEEEQLYEYDNEILKNVIELTEQYKQYYLSLLRLGNEKNYLDLTKFVDFLAEYYGKHMDYFEFTRDQLDAQAMGFNLFNPSLEDNREVIDEFFQRKVSQLEKEQEKSLQYIKKEKKNDSFRRKI